MSVCSFIIAYLVVICIAYTSFWICLFVCMSICTNLCVKCTAYISFYICICVLLSFCAYLCDKCKAYISFYICLGVFALAYLCNKCISVWLYYLLIACRPKSVCISDFQFNSTLNYSLSLFSFYFVCLRIRLWSDAFNPVSNYFSLTFCVVKDGADDDVDDGVDHGDVDTGVDVFDVDAV